MSTSNGDLSRLNKVLWTQDDYDQMGWHDVGIHGMAFRPKEYEILFDIDYILAWINPEPPLVHFSFWLAPATFIFRNVCDFNAEIDGPPNLEIMGIARSNPRKPKNANFIDLETEWTWTIELVRGEITFSAAGFSQYIRRKPIRTSSQQFSLQDRGGISFEKNIESNKHLEKL